MYQLYCLTILKSATIWFTNFQIYKTCAFDENLIIMKILIIIVLINLQLIYCSNCSQQISIRYNKYLEQASIETLRWFLGKEKKFIYTFRIRSRFVLLFSTKYPHIYATIYYYHFMKCVISIHIIINVHNDTHVSLYHFSWI